MSLSDLLYPGNPVKREQIIRKSQELIDLMKNNFRATNSLTEIVNKHLHSSFSPITLDEKATVKENCDVMIERVNQIQEKVKEVDEELKKKLEPALYESLQHMSLQGFSNISTAVKVAITSVCTLSTVVLVMHLMKDIKILACITVATGLISLGLFATIVLGLLAVDGIVSAIIGYIEQGKLETALEEYEEALAKFRPASEKYDMAIYEVMFKLKFLKE